MNEECYKDTGSHLLFKIDDVSLLTTILYVYIYVYICLHIYTCFSMYLILNNFQNVKMEMTASKSEFDSLPTQEKKFTFQHKKKNSRSITKLWDKFNFILIISNFKT